MGWALALIQETSSVCFFNQSRDSGNDKYRQQLADVQGTLAFVEVKRAREEVEISGELFSAASEDDEDNVDLLTSMFYKER